MQITDNHIQQLYKFTRQHYVEHYDVQTELVDHLANDIEEIWKENPKLTFEQARNKSFKKFGIFGFMDVVEAKQKQMNKRYRNIIWRFMKEWFSIPKIILTIFCFYFFYLLMTLNIDSTFLSIFMLCLAVLDVYYSIKLNQKAKKKFKSKDKKYLLEDIIFRAGAFSSLIIFSNLFQLSTFLENTTSIIGKSFVATLITIAIIYSYITLIVLPKKADELLQEAYPEYKLVKNL